MLSDRKGSALSKHLTLNDRILIERFIIEGYSFSFIAKKLARNPSTIAREVKSHRRFVTKARDDVNDCVSFFRCLHRNLCDTETKYSCFGRCKTCTEYDCRKLCKDYVSRHCPLLDKSPYVCNGCDKEGKCQRDHAYYSAHIANSGYLSTLKNSRKGVRTSPQRLCEINEILAPLVEKGQSINHIMASHSEEIGLSRKTIYNYIDQNAFSIGNIDLPKKVAYRHRKKIQPITKLEYQCRKGRTIEDFKTFIESNPKLPIVEMDTVKGARGCKKVLLTMIFRNCNFMLIFLLPDGTQNSVVNVFDRLTLLLGLDTFKKLFPVILTDNGVEFKGAHNLEFTENGARRTRIFYCDPQASWQKPHVEKNHVLLRRILPKGTTFKFLDDEDIRLISCHVNSVARDLFDNCCPFDLMNGEEQKKLLENLTLTKVPADEVCLKPALLKRR